MFRLVLIVLFYRSIEGVNIKTTFRPPSKDVFPRLRLDATLPNLPELTFCSWIKIRHLNDSLLAPVLSYATPRSNNELLIILFIQSGEIVIQVDRASNVVDSKCSFTCQVGSWCHICVSWFGDNGFLKTFVNGKKCGEGTLVFNEPYLPSGGVLIVGQEQDGLDAYYNVKEAFIGDIADFQLWDEVLSENQIEEASVCRGKRKKGNVVSWLETPMVAIDGVVFSATQLCLH